MTQTLLPMVCAFGRRAVATLVVAIAAGACSDAIAVTTIFDSVGFELPKFSTTYSNLQTTYAGQLEGQAIYPEPLPVGTWEQTKPIGVYDSKARVVDNTVVIPAGGNQSVQVTRAADTDARWGVRGGAWPSERYVCIDWDMYVEQTILPSGSFGPFFAVEAYDDDSATIGLLASFGVDASNGEVLFQAEGTGFLTAPGPSVAFNTWNHFTILLDYVTHTFDLYLNDVFVPAIDASGNTPGILNTFVDHALGNPLDEFTDAPIATLAAGDDPDSQGAVGTAYFDNYKVVQSSTNPKIPEPASCALAGFGLLTLISWLRARNRA